MTAYVRGEQLGTAVPTLTSRPLRSPPGGLIDVERAIVIVAKRKPAPSSRAISER